MVAVTITRNVAAAERAEKDRIEAEMSAKRKAAFEAETDPLIGEVIRGEMSVDDYKDKCEAIKARFPYPEVKK